MADETAAVDLPVPPPAAFPYLTEPELLLRWVGGMVACELLPGPPAGVGRRLRQVVEQGGRRFEIVAETPEEKPPRLLVVRLDVDGIGARATHRLEPSGGGSRLTTSLAPDGRSLLARVAGPVVVAIAGARLRSDLERLAAAIDATEGPPR
jgi:uncharacterized protein YndB with AHSA1/START domain